MIVRAISEGDLYANIALLARLETALFAVNEALKVGIYTEDKALLTGMRNDLREIIRRTKDEVGLP